MHRKVVCCALDQGEFDDNSSFLVGNPTTGPCPVATHHLHGHTLSHHPLVLNLDGQKSNQVGGHGVIVHLYLNSVGIRGCHQVSWDVAGGSIESSTLGYSRHRIY